MNTNTIPKNYTKYSVRTYRNVVDENGEYATTDFIDGSDYTHAREIFINALKNTEFYCVELIVNTADEDDDSVPIVIKQTPARRTKLIKLNTFNFIIRNSKTNKRTNKMNTINERTATLTKLIAEIVELDTGKYDGWEYCLTVQLDVLISQLQKYKQMCEEPLPTDKCSHPTDCPCADCEKANPLCEDCRKRPKYDDGVCEECYMRHGCDTESEDEESDEDSEDEEECEHCECEGCRGWKEEWGDEEGTTRVCEDATCGKEFSMYDPHYYDDDQCLCYCCEECYKNDSKDYE